MAENKKSFIAYVDWKETFDVLPNDEAGKLVKHLFAYVNDENPETDDVLINAVFANIKQTLKRDLRKYETIREKRAEAGRASGDKRKQKRTKRTSVQSDEQTRTKRTDSVSVNVSDNDSDINYKEIVDTYHALCPKLSKIAALTDARKSHIKSRVKDFGIDNFYIVLEKAGKSDFLRGDSNPKWKATFDWLINPSNFVKVMEGNYDNKQTKPILAR